MLRKIQDEIRLVLQGAPRPPTSAELVQMMYLDDVIAEGIAASLQWLTESLTFLL